MTGRRTFAWIFALLVACAPAPQPVGAPVAASPTAPADAPTVVPDAPRPSPSEEVCLTLQRAFQARLDTATGACDTEFDCGCYAGVAPGLGCGGMTDFKSATALASLTTQFLGAGCAYPQTCAATTCVADCIDHQCVRRVQPY